MTMQTAVASQNLIELIAGRTVLAALFTTFTFEPEFFELEVIPLLLNSEIAYSSDDRVKRFIVRENLRESGLRIDVFYDLPMYRATGANSPEMEYGCHGVNHPGGAFHGKVSMLLVEDDHGAKSLLLGAGSNNLTRAGWWDNIECQHWHELTRGTFARQLKNIVQDDLEFLDWYRFQISDKDHSALAMLRGFLNDTSESNSAQSVHYFGLSMPENRQRFLPFLFSSQLPLSEADNWHLEIISPFFAEDPGNNEHEYFLKHGVQDIVMLLPMDEEDRPRCLDTYYQAIIDSEGIRWGRWNDELQKTLGISGGLYRPLHAKVYRFYNRKSCWVFVGSVNFTHKALNDNIEAGFLVACDSRKPLLEALPEDTEFDHFAELQEPTPGQEVDDDETLPEIHLAFDWINHRLQGQAGEDEEVEIQILGAEGEPVIGKWKLSAEVKTYRRNVAALESLLKQGSLLKISGRWLGENGDSFPAHRVLLQQIGWSHKPLEIPELSAEQILAIYAGMTPERRSLMLINAKIRELVLNQQAGELTYNMDEHESEQFFSEYAEIFNAFRTLRQRLQKALDENRTSDLDYYLSGTGVDSLPTLLQRAQQDGAGKEPMKGVSAYLLLLSAQEIYQQKGFRRRPQVKEKRQDVELQIAAIERSERIRFKEDSPEKRKAFFAWFREQFFREYHAMVETAQ